MVLEILRIEDMRVERDRQAVLAALRGLPGLQRASASLASRTLLVERADDASLAAIIAALRGAGYPVTVLA